LAEGQQKKDCELPLKICIKKASAPLSPSGLSPQGKEKKE